VEEYNMPFHIYEENEYLFVKLILNSSKDVAYQEIETNLE